MAGNVDKLCEEFWSVPVPSESAVMSVLVDSADAIARDWFSSPEEDDGRRRKLWVGEGVMTRLNLLVPPSRQRPLSNDLHRLREAPRDGVLCVLACLLAPLGVVSLARSEALWRPGIRRVNHDDAYDSGTDLLAKDLGDFKTDEATEGPPSKNDAAVRDCLLDDAGVVARHLGEAVPLLVGLEVRVGDAVHGAAETAEAVVGKGGATAVVEEEEGCGLDPWGDSALVLDEVEVGEHGGGLVAEGWV